MLLNSKKVNEINAYLLVWKNHNFLQKSVVSSVRMVARFSRKQVNHTNKIIYDRKTNTGMAPVIAGYYSSVLSEIRREELARTGCLSSHKVPK